MFFPVTTILAAIYGAIIFWLTLQSPLTNGHLSAAPREFGNDQGWKSAAVLKIIANSVSLVLPLVAISELSTAPRIVDAVLALMYCASTLTYLFSVYYYEQITGRCLLRTVSLTTTFGAIILLAVLNLYSTYTTMQVLGTRGRRHYIIFPLPGAHHNDTTKAVKSL